MKKILNKTHRPLRVGLPQGKTLHLGPKKTGQIADNAVDHPAVQRLLEAGEVEIVDAAAGEERGPQGDEPGHEEVHGHHPKSVHKSGDR
jgi:hypothetical protein